MIAKTMVVTVVVLLALAVAGVGSSVAGPIPASFVNGWVGFLCVEVSIPNFPPLNVLVQVNFDKAANGGISLSWADSLFNYVTSNLALLDPFIGDNLQITCSFSPGEIQDSSPGATALVAAQLLSGTFQQANFFSYLILNSFRSTTPGYLDPADIVRTDGYLVVGLNSLTYVASTEIIEDLLPARP